MRILIIEDEPHTALDLKEMILEGRPHFKIDGVVDSVKSGKAWFSANPTPDLIISDIALGDGSSFDILYEFNPQCPVVFCTAYDEYALEAFQANGLAYLLKPILKRDLDRTFKRMQDMGQKFTLDWSENLSLENSIVRRNPGFVYKTNFLVNYRDRIIPLTCEQIICFQYIDRSVKVGVVGDKVYSLTSSLDYLDRILDPYLFFRLSRQFIVNRNYIDEIQQDHGRKLRVHVANSQIEPIKVSKEKATPFLNWLDSDLV